MALILVTGAAGNLGRNLVARLLARGDRVRAFDLPTKANTKRLRGFGDGVELALGDVTNAADVERAVAGVDAIAHLAGILPPASERNPRATNAVNAGGTFALISAAEKLTPGVRFVFASSCSVHGFGQAARGPATGDSPTEATDAYTTSKIAAEEALRASSLSYTILRVSAAIEGSASVQDPIVLRLMFEYDADHPIELVHGDDVAAAFASALIEPRAHRRVFPIAGGVGCRLTQRGLMEMSFGAIGVRDLPRSIHGRAPNYTCFMDTTESQEILRFQAHDLDDIRRDMLENLGLLAPLARLASPLVRRYLLHLSGPHNGAPSRPTWQDHIAAGH